MLEKIEVAEAAPKLFGKFDENYKALTSELGVNLALRDGVLSISGAEARVVMAVKVIKSLLGSIENGEEPDSAQVSRVIDMWARGEGARASTMSKDTVSVTARGKRVVCKTTGQRAYVNAINKSTITLAVGPAGTGKTYLAVCLAVNALKSGAVERIVLSRPAIEAGEKLGFLPGDLQEKVDPYLQPLYDALQDLLGDTYQKYLERGTVIIAPLAYMRGRTLSNAFVILDEAQNTTVEQMKMFLTRLGEGSKMVVTGDITQVDLPRGVTSGLTDAVAKLTNIEGIEIATLSDTDVVRHALVTRIIRAYESTANNLEEQKNGRK